jgi:hypothetical protein
MEIFMNFVIYSYIGVMVILVLEYIKNRFMSNNSFWSLTFWGILTTFPHEFAHFIVALLTGARPTGLTIIPKKQLVNGVEYWTMGSVQAYINKLNGVFIGLAPLLWLLAGYFISKYYFLYFEANLINTIIFYITIYLCITNGIPSGQDLKVVFNSHWWLILIIIGGLLWQKKNIISILQ